MIKHYEAAPESYDQEEYGRTGYLPEDRPKPPCGAVACLAGTAIICDSKNVRAGVRRLLRLVDNGHVHSTATRLMGLEDVEYVDSIFEASALGWPNEFRQQYRNAKTYKGKARAAINLLKAILKTDGKILE